MSLPYLDEARIRAAVSPAIAVAAVREAFRADGDGGTRVPAVINLGDSRHLGRVPREDRLGVRSRARCRQDRLWIYDNPALGLPTGWASWLCSAPKQACRSGCCSTTASSPTFAQVPRARLRLRTLPRPVVDTIGVYWIRRPGAPPSDVPSRSAHVSPRGRLEPRRAWPAALPR